MVLLTDAPGRDWATGTSWGRGFVEFGGGGRGAEAGAGCDLESFDFEEEES